MKYTEKIHATRLLGMLNKKDPCLCCPKYKYYDPVHSDIIIDDCHSKAACRVCREFVGICAGICPCPTWGKAEAIKRTWLALEEKGYLE